MGNTLADFLGHREFQIKTLMVDADEVLPELTRNEYLRMLQTAKALKNERVYFLIKVFANVDLPVQQASKLTVEAAEEGKLVINRGGGREIIRLPKCLCQELLSYAKRSGITTGPLFLTRQKKPMRRTQISDSIRRMCLEAKIPEGKGNPRCLRKLYKETMRSIYERLSEGILTQNEFLEFKAVYAHRCDEAERAAGALQREIKAATAGTSGTFRWIEDFREHRNLTKLTRKVVVMLIKQIKVYKDQRIHIQFYQENECRCLAERIMSAADGQPAADYRKGDKDGEDQP